MTAWSNRYKITKKETTVPWPGIACLRLVSKINAKRCEGTYRHKLCHEDFSLNRVQDKKRHIKEQLATLEKAEAAAAEFSIRTGVFGNKASADARADFIAKQVAESLDELQEEVRALENSLQDLALVIVQRQTAEESKQKEPLEKGGSPNGRCKSHKVGADHGQHGEHEESNVNVVPHSCSHRRIINGIIHEQAKRRKAASSVVPGSAVHGNVKN